MRPFPPTSRNSSTPATEPTAGGTALWPWLLAGVAGTGLMALWFPLWPYVGRVPPADVRTLAPTLAAGLLYALLLLALYAVYLIAVGRVARYGVAGRWAGRPLLPLLLGGLLLALPLLFAYPINATDVYRYVIRGRVASAYGQSPFVAPPAQFIGDPFMPLAGEWAGETSPYGPLWEIVAAGVTAVSGDNLLLGVWLFKLLALACFLAGGALIWAAAGERPGRAAAALLWAWNPALLLTFALNGHNDALMLLWLLLGYWVGRRGRPAAGFLLMCLAALTKPVAALALPVFFIAYWRGLPDGRRRLRFALAAGGGAAALTWLAFLPWAAPGRFWQTPLELVGRLLREATDSGGFSPAVWLYFALGQRVDIEVIGAILRGLFLLFTGWVLWRGWRGRPARRGAADLAFGYLAQALSFRIWYSVWPFPWLVLDGTDDAAAAYRLRAGLWFLLLAQLSVVFYGQVRVAVWGGDQVITHLIGVPLVFGLPWLLARWSLPGLTPRS
jgi:hypothetical protein